MQNLNQNFLDKFQGITEPELQKILKDENIILYKDYEHQNSYTGYFTYNYFRVYIKIDEGRVTQTTT